MPAAKSGGVAYLSARMTFRVRAIASRTVGDIGCEDSDGYGDDSDDDERQEHDGQDVWLRPSEGVKLGEAESGIDVTQSPHGQDR